MSRFFIEEYSDEHEEESIENEELQIDFEEDNFTLVHPEEIPLEYFIFKLDQDNDKKDQDQIDNKCSNIIECRNLFDNILQNIDNNQIQKSHNEFNKLQDVYKQLQKGFKKNNVPNFFIKKLYEINQKINEQSRSSKQARTFQKDLKKFNRNFEEELAEYEKHPENFQNELDAELNTDQDENANDNFSMSSSYEEEEEKEENATENTNNNKEKNTPQNAEKANDDESIRKELDRYVQYRTDVIMKTDIDHLFIFYEKVTDEKLVRKFQLEICYAVSHVPDWQKISYRNILKILDFLPDLIHYVKGFVPFFGRLSKDLTWYSTKLTNASRTYHFYRTMHKFVNILNYFKQNLLQINEFKSYVRLEILFIGYLFCNEKCDISPHAMNMMKVLEKDIFNKSITNNYMYQTSLY
ncbi:Translation initiation factor 3 subunit c [Tritrichomonas musculus]|uniref:Translation initiation factor 3 subunit c n=1 Tax=Tritrichomonas musculus TaxID=1915356 RepID=A0ABR2H9T1_9EUKA